MFEHVYVFLRADGLRKVGHTGDIHRRRKELVAATGLEHQIERVWRLTEKAHAIEGYVHYNLRSLKVQGCGSLEVYDVPLERLAEEIERGIEWVAKLGIRPGG